MRRSSSALIVVLLLVLAGCSGLTVQSDWDPEVDFSRYESFVLIESPESSVNPLIERRILDALADRLEASGHRRVESVDEADLAVAHRLVTEDRQSVETVYSGWRSTGFRTSQAGWGRTPERSTTRVRSYTVGELIVAVFRTSDRELVWQGSGSRTIRPASTPEQSERRIREAVDQILSDFPPES